MTLPFDPPVISPVIVGRESQIDALGRVLGEVFGGRGRTLIFSGEAGIGKSRLVAEARTQAERRGFLCLDGSCFEPDPALPFAPLLDLLRARFASRPAEHIASELGPVASELGRLLPELTSLLPGLALSVPLEPEAEKRRLVHALSTFLAGLAATQPLLVILEDLHWSDDTSLDFLIQFARRIAAAPVLVLLTYRSDEVHPSLDHFLAALDRGRLATELTLDRLSPAETSELVRAILPRDRRLPTDVRDGLYELTEGNPFFVEEVVTSLIAGGEVPVASGVQGWKTVAEFHIPRSVQDAVQSRAAQLSDKAREILALAAVVGRRFDFPLLEVLTGREESALLPPIKELIAAHLVLEETAELFVFRHALTRHAVYGELLVRERRALHRRVAEAIIQIHNDALDAYLADLAYHFAEAGEWRETLAYGRLAAERSQTLFAPRAAAEHFGRALDAACRLAIVPDTTLYRGRGLAFATLGDFEPARADLETALELARAAGDLRTEWQALLDLGLLWASRDYARTGDYCRRALDMAKKMGDPAILAHSLNRLGNWHTNVDEPLAGQQYHEEALAIFRRRSDKSGVAETLDLLGIAYQMGGDLLQSAERYNEAVVLFRELDDRQGLASGLSVMAARGIGYVIDVAASKAMPLDDPLEEVELALRLAREIGWRAGESFALNVLGMCLGTKGDYGHALGCLRESLAIATEIEHREWQVFGHASLGALRLDLFEHAAARQELETGLDIAQAIGSPYWVRWLAGHLALACLAGGDLLEARAVLDAALGRENSAQSLGQRYGWLARAELAIAQSQPDVALTIADRLIASAPNALNGLVIPRLWQLRAWALTVLGQLPEADEALQPALETAEAQGYRPLLWRLLVTLGKLRQDQGRHDEAERAFSTARAVVEELAAGIPDEALREGFVSQALILIPSMSPHPSRRTKKDEFGGLTAREREVTILISQGKSNRAIANELFLSERTVEGHVANVLAKLSFGSRAQIAAWAVETGLTTRGA